MGVVVGNQKCLQEELWKGADTQSIPNGMEENQDLTKSSLDHPSDPWDQEKPRRDRDWGEGTSLNGKIKDEAGTWYQ